MVSATAGGSFRRKAYWGYGLIRIQFYSLLQLPTRGVTGPHHLAQLEQKLRETEDDMTLEHSPRSLRKLNSSRRREDNRNAAKGSPVTVTRRLPDGTTVTEVQADPTVEKAQKALRDSQRAQSRPNRSRSRSSRTPERKSADPRGTTERSRRVTAALGNKPNRMPWRQFHAIAQAAPWTLTDSIPSPARTLTGTEASIIKAAHDQLAEGRLDAQAYTKQVTGLVLFTRTEGNR